jgi:DNA gyrase subunit A
MVNEPNQRIVQKVIEDEMKQSYLDYSMSVIVGRALPDVRDGLKPVHRRVLFAMHEMGLVHNKPFKKCARIVGDCLGKFHPHGDMAVYDSLVRLAQDFSLRYPLIQGQGNFGSVDGDNAAAMRYTEARLNPLAEELLADLEKKTVKFTPNFDGSMKEPTVLPAKFPNLLVNGSAGIAVGMATNIPPHNLRETCDGAIALIDNKELSCEQLMQKIPAPDFPTGGLIIGNNGIKDAYATGKGKLVVRARTSLEEVKGRTRIIVTEIPYMVNKATLVENIADLVRDKKIFGITDIRDESDRTGMRIVFDLKSGANSDIVLNQLFTQTRLQDSFGITLLALVKNEPKLLPLKDMLQFFISHRQEVVRKRTEFELAEAAAKSHILEGIIIALDNIDAVIKLIKGSKSAESARKSLIENFKLSEKQAQAVLDTKLQRLTSLEQDKVRIEQAELLKAIENFKIILGSEQKIFEIIRKELAEIRDRYGDNRRTQIVGAEAVPIEEEQLIKPEDVVITITHAGYVKRIPLEAYKAQRRGGRGIIGTETKEEDFVEDIFVANSTDNLLFFTNLGKVHWLKVWQLPEAGRYAKGTAIVNLVELSKDEKVTAFIPVKTFTPENYLFMITKNGTVKKTSLEEFSNPRKGGIAAIGLDEKDELVGVLLTNGKTQVIVGTAKGMAIRFDETDVRSMGRAASGVIGIKLREDSVVGAVLAEDSKQLLTITEKGFGKRTQMSEYRVTNRGGIGVTNLKITDKNGDVVGISAVEESDEVMLMSQKGLALRTPASQISSVGRATQGVRLMKLEPDDKLVAVAKIAQEAAENGNGTNGNTNNGHSKELEGTE